MRPRPIDLIKRKKQIITHNHETIQKKTVLRKKTVTFFSQTKTLFHKSNNQLNIKFRVKVTK